MNNSRYRHVEDEFPPYEFKYFVAYFRHNSTLQYHVRLPNEVSTRLKRMNVLGNTD